MAFIEKLDAQSLNLSSEEFERHMSGQASPRFHSSEGAWLQTGTGRGADAANPVLDQLNHNQEQLSHLISRQQTLVEAAQSMQADLISWTDCVKREVNNILEEYPLEILQQRVSAIDAHNVDSDHLPLPLTPQVFAQ